jgi:hypothetical protein
MKKKQRRPSRPPPAHLQELPEYLLVALAGEIAFHRLARDRHPERGAVAHPCLDVEPHVVDQRAVEVEHHALHGLLHRAR